MEENPTTNRLRFPQCHSKGNTKRCCLMLSPFLRLPSPFSLVTPKLPKDLPFHSVPAVDCEVHLGVSARRSPQSLGRTGCILGASSWGHSWPLGQSWGLLADDCEIRFHSLVSGTLQHTEDIITSAGKQPPPKGRTENTIKAASMAQVSTPKNI